MRACRSLALTVSSFSVMPVAFLHSCVIWPFSSTSEAGTKSAQRSQWTAVSCAKAGARPLARMAARPPACAATALDPDSLRSLRRAMRAMILLPSLLCAAVTRARYCALELHVSGRALARRGVACQLCVRSALPPQKRHSRVVRPDVPGLTLFENTPIQPKPQPQLGPRMAISRRSGPWGNADMAVTGMARIGQVMPHHGPRPGLDHRIAGSTCLRDQLLADRGHPPPERRACRR